MRMRIGLVGLGAMGQNHMRVMAELGVLGCVYDTDATKVEQAKIKYGVIGSTDLDGVFTYPIDGVVIAAPTQFHLQIARRCMESRVPVLIEKPISNDLQEAQDLVGLAGAEKRNRVLAVGYIERFNPAFKFLLTLIDEGYFGELVSVNVKRVGGDPRTADNIILDLMTHDIDLLMAIFKKEPLGVSHHEHSNADHSLVDSAQALFDFGTASATCEANWVSPVKIREIHITGTRGCVVVDMIRQELTKLIGLSRNSKILEVHNFNSEPLKEELCAFISDIKEGVCRKSVSGQDAVNALRWTLKAAGKL